MFSFPLIAEHACSTQPCKNGASCIDTTGGYICTCAPGWTGAFCEASKSFYEASKSGIPRHIHINITFLYNYTEIAENEEFDESEKYAITISFCCVLFLNWIESCDWPEPVYLAFWLVWDNDVTFIINKPFHHHFIHFCRCQWVCFRSLSPRWYMCRWR